VNFYTRKRRMPQVIIVSLIDIFAILLIFVIVTTTFKTAQPEVTIKLPESKTAAVSEGAREPVVLSIAENDDIFLGAKPVALDALKAAIQELMGQTPPPVLALNADKKAPFGTVIKVLDVLKEAGVKGNLAAFTESAR
jgi:biopolymer transport protein ExbD